MKHAAGKRKKTSVSLSTTLEKLTEVHHTLNEMIQDQLPHLIGKSLAEFFGVFFYTRNFDPNPTALYFPVAKGTWIGITSDGNGRFKSFPPLTDLYHIPQVGFNCVAPLSFCILESEKYDSIVSDVNYEEDVYFSFIKLSMVNGRFIQIKSEDDLLTVI